MCKVLVADDHPLFRQAMQIAIEGLDAHDDPVVLEASSIDEVRALAARERDLDLLLLDLRMPGMDGFAGLVALRREFPALPVVIVSASEEHKTIREALALGAAGYIPKSLRPVRDQERARADPARRELVPARRPGARTWAGRRS